MPIAEIRQRLVLATVAVLFLLLGLSFPARASSQIPSEVRIDVSGYVPVADGRLFYETVGRGPVIILIHDHNVHREIWDAQLPVLSQHYKVVRYDRRGYGKSSPESGASSDVDDLNRLFEHLGIDRACVMGMSAG